MPENSSTSSLPTSTPNLEKNGGKNGELGQRPKIILHHIARIPGVSQDVSSTSTSPEESRKRKRSEHDTPEDTVPSVVESIQKMLEQRKHLNSDDAQEHARAFGEYIANFLSSERDCVVYDFKRYVPKLLKAFEAEKAASEQSILDLRQEKEDLLSKIGSLSSESRNAETKIDNLKRWNNSLETENRKFREENGELRQENENLKTIVVAQDQNHAKKIKALDLTRVQINKILEETKAQSNKILEANNARIKKVMGAGSK